MNERKRKLDEVLNDKGKISPKNKQKKVNEQENSNNTTKNTPKIKVKEKLNKLKNNEELSNVIIKKRGRPKRDPIPSKVIKPKETSNPISPKIIKPKESVNPIPPKIIKPKETPSPIAPKIVKPKETPSPIAPKIVKPKVTPNPITPKVVKPKVTTSPVPPKIIKPKVTPNPVPPKIIKPKVTPNPVPPKIIKPKVTPKILNHINRSKYFNGDKNEETLKFHSTRTRKPNPRFQDYVVSPHFGPASPDVSNREKEKESPIKPKAVIKSPEIKYDILEDDPLALPKNDDEVRSFLPVFEIAPPFGNVVIIPKDNNIVLPPQPIISSSNINEEKENVEMDADPKVIKKTPLSKINHSLVNIDKMTNGKTIENSKSETVNGKEKSETVNIIEKPEIINVTENVSVKEKSEIVQKNINTPKTNTKLKTPVNNGSSNIIKSKDVRYALVDHFSANNQNRTPKNCVVDFNKLVRSLKSVKLPAANWKIRIVVSRQQTINEVAFTNKEMHERCVKFSRIFPGYTITFGKSIVKLIGAPYKISSFNDISVLLDIIHNISLRDPVIEYSDDVK